MKKIFLLLLSFILCNTVMNAQAKEKNSLSLSIGPAFAMSKFASTDAVDPLAGLAKTGFAASLSWSKMLSAYIGIAAQLQGQRNAVNTTTLKKYFEDATGYANWNFDKTGWSYGALMAGPESRMALDKADKLQFIARIMAGIIYAKSPGMSGQSRSANTAGYVAQDKKTATSFILNTMVGLNYSTSNNLFLSAAISYNGTNKMTYKQVTTTVTTTQGTPASATYAIQQYSNTVDGKQSISSVNLLLGIGFRF
jgi:hypothetical protein